MFGRLPLSHFYKYMSILWSYDAVDYPSHSTAFVASAGVSPPSDNIGDLISNQYHTLGSILFKHLAPNRSFLPGAVYQGIFCRGHC